MISYYDGQLTDILKGNITKQPEMQALSYALQKGTQLLYGYTQRLYIYDKIDEQPEDVLNLMAAELRTQYYNDGLDIGIKRALIKNTLAWYMAAGTPAAVEELVTTVFGEGKVEEWFEYGGEPYMFRITTNAQLTPETNEFFHNMIQKVKNTRSHLEAIKINRKINGPAFCGIGGITRIRAVPIYQKPLVDQEVGE